MRPRARRARAILRDRRRDAEWDAIYGPPLMRAMTGFDLYIARQYAVIQSVARAVRPPGMSREEMDRTVSELFR